MIMDLTLDPPRQAAPIDAVTNQGASYLVAASQVAGRTLKKSCVRPRCSSPARHRECSSC